MYSDIWFKINKDIDLTIPIVKRNNVYSEINKVIKFLNKLDNPQYFFSCGTVLGLVREGKLLDWDTDVDIDILEPTESLIEQIIFEMKKLGYSFQRKLKKNNRYNQLVFYKAPYHSIDFCFWYKKKNFFVNDVPETNIFKRSHPVKIYDKFKEIKIKNIFFKIPYDTESYFKLLYGDDWRTPKKYKNWLKNANDLKFDLSISRVFFKILWKFKIGRKYL